MFNILNAILNIIAAWLKSHTTMLFERKFDDIYEHIEKL